MTFPDHFDGKRYFNPDAPQAKGFAALLKWQLTSRPERSPSFIDDVVPSTPPRRIDNDALHVTLINHSTVLLQQREANILTDPIWSKRASPLQWVGPARRRAPGVAFADLPPIDIVLLSHNHYDHLDAATVRRLDAQFVVPAGVGSWLRARNIRNVHELDWGQSVTLGGITIHSVPALHFSARGLFDRNRTLWCGYLISSHDRLIYFAGDTAFGDHFQQIRRRYGSPHLALLPIGAYAPRWFMGAVHMSPEDAVRARAILDPQAAIPIHHGTFQLTDESIDAPRRELLACAPRDSFLILHNGESASLP